MSCRSRAKRVRSFSTARPAFSCWARSRSMLRLITARTPKMATDAAITANAVPTWLLQSSTAPRAITSTVSTTTSGAGDPEREDHHAGDGYVDDGRDPLLAQQHHHQHAEDHEQGDVGDSPTQRRVVDQLGPVGAGADPDGHVGRSERQRHDDAEHAAQLVAVGPALQQRADQEEQPDTREERTQPPHPDLLVRRGGGVRAHGGQVSHAQTRAVSLLIRHAAPATKIPSQATMLTTAYHGSSRVSGARATSATPYMGVQ